MTEPQNALKNRNAPPALQLKNALVPSERQEQNLARALAQRRPHVGLETAASQREPGAAYS
jgi:hypothetical protein